MGSKSNSRSSQTTTNNNTSLGIGGNNEGIVGDSNTISNDYSSIDNSTTDNSYTDTSRHYTDESYTDKSYNDESYSDSSTDNSGDNAGNSGSIVITDGGAFDLVESVVSDFVSMGVISLETMGKTAELSMEQSSLNSGLMRDVANHALSEYASLSDDSIGAIEAVSNASIAGAQSNVDQMKQLTLSALQEMSAQSSVAISSSSMANRDALAASTKLMTTVSTNGNDLLIDGVVNIAKYAGFGVGALVLGLVVIKVIGGKK